MKHCTYFLSASLLCFFCLNIAIAQDEAPQGMSPEEYQVARSATVDDLDNDTYVKIGEGDYVLDRYEMKPPYYITGDSGIKKRIDLYKFLDRESMDELGLVAFFTNTETDETFNLVIPNLASKGEVWNMYFDDIHQHDREEEDVALKMSYVLSKEVAYLMQKSSGVDMSAMDQENSDYDFCFAPDALVTLADGSQLPVSQIQIGDQVMTVVDGQPSAVSVEGINTHQKEDIGLSKVLLFSEMALSASADDQPTPSEVATLVATANHPVMTDQGAKALGDLQMGDRLSRYNPQSGQLEWYQVHLLAPQFRSVKQVYNLEVSGDSYLVNNVLVLEK